MRYAPFGGLDSLRPVDVPEPDVRAGQVLVDVVAISVNPVDWKLRSGLLRWLSPLRVSTIPCFDFAGRVVGSASGAHQPGDAVFGLTRIGQPGSACARLALDAGQLTRIPDGVSFEQAAGVPLAGMTALQALRVGRPSRRVLVVGAAGGVGHYAVQIAKALGAEVTAVCSGANRDWVLGLGADEVLDYRGGETGRPRPEFDRVLDAVSLGTFGAWRRWLRRDGVYVTLLPRWDLLIRGLAGWPPEGQRAYTVVLRPE
ncbi:MAG: NAD(P)-dependent alcohol dehydrogenase [Methylotetracoccus sp.]